MSYDVGIIGGGPAGAAMAAYLAKAGIKCVVFESENFPRPHVGESLVPSSTRVFRDLCFLEKMENAGFPKKYGAAWTTSYARPVYRHNWMGVEPFEKAEVSFSERSQSGVDMDYTYHVDRGKFDEMLLEHARQLGAEVQQGTKVTAVDFSSDRAKITYENSSGISTVPVKVVVDASGRRTFLGNHLRLKVKDKVFDQYAIHTWFEDFDREYLSGVKDLKDYIFVHFLPISNSWIWQIPITETITSVGVVTQKKNISRERKEREEFFWEAVQTRPEVFQKLKSAKQLRPLQEEGDYSYAMTQITGDRFVMIGDAARFVDPIFSTGVSIALNSARFASRDIIEAAKRGDFSRDSFGNYETVIRRGTNNWYEFISVYYRLNVLFTWFVNHPEYRLDVLKLLQGDVYDEESPAVLQKMKEVVAEVENNREHIWHSSLGDLTAGNFRPSF